MRVFASIAAIGVASALSAAHAFDDPAITVCEAIAKARMSKMVNYERTGATISGRTVTLQFSSSVGEEPPRRSELVCEFVATGDGRFKLRPYEALDIDCSREIAAVQETQNWRGTPENQKAAEARMNLQACQAVIEADIAILERRYKDREFLLVMTGIYPIEGSATGLKSE